MPVVYSTENSPDGELYEILKRSIKVLKGWGYRKIFSCQEVRIIKIFYESFYVKFINKL